MKQHSVLTKLYFLFIHADEIIDEKELQFGKQMIRYEGIDEDSFNLEMKLLRDQNKEDIYKSCIKYLSQFNKVTQIRYVAWMSLVANADGFMDSREWQLMYRIYHKDLNLSLSDIMAKQKVLSHQIRSHRPGGIKQ